MIPDGQWIDHPAGAPEEEKSGWQAQRKVEAVSRWSKRATSKRISGGETQKKQGVATVQQGRAVG